MADEEKEPEAAAPPEEGAEELPPPEKKAGNPLIPVILMIVAVPALSFVMFNFVFMPMMKEQVVAVAEALKEEIVVEEGHGAHDGSVVDDHGGKGETFAYLVGDVVANLSGTRQSRYLKVNITLEGNNAKTADGKPVLFLEFMETNRAKVMDTVGTVITALQLSDLDQPGIRNIVRQDLIDALNNELKGPRIKDIYFSEWVVQ